MLCRFRLSQVERYPKLFMVPPLIAGYRRTSFTLADGLAEWKGPGWLYIAEKGGIMRLDEKQNYWSLSSFIVDPALRGSGIGTHMLNSIKHFDKPIYLTVQQDNPALQLYQRRGFQILETKNGRHHMKRKTEL